MWQPGWEKGVGGERIHVYVRLSPFTVHVNLITTLLIGYTPIKSLKKH